MRVEHLHPRHRPHEDGQIRHAALLVDSGEMCGMERETGDGAHPRRQRLTPRPQSRSRTQT